MSDKISKLLAKLQPKQRDLLLVVLQKLRQGETQGLDIKQLKNQPGIMRVRIGDYRIICSVQSDGSLNVISLSRRTSQTYK